MFIKQFIPTKNDSCEEIIGKSMGFFLVAAIWFGGTILFVKMFKEALMWVLN